MNETRPRARELTAAATVAIVFGALTIAAGGLALFAGQETRAAFGEAVPFVLWFNFAAGLFYNFAGAGLVAMRRWAVRLSAAIALATVGVFAAFGLHVLQGGAYEARTVGAMIVRAAIWIVITIVAMRTIPAQR